MIERNTFTIDRNKSKEFRNFVAENAKGKEFWEDVNKTASQPIDRRALNELFKEKK